MFQRLRKVDAYLKTFVDQILFELPHQIDGPVGFIMAVMYSQVAFNKYAGLWALRRQAKLDVENEKDAD